MEVHRLVQQIKKPFLFIFLCFIITITIFIVIPKYSIAPKLAKEVEYRKVFTYPHTGAVVFSGNSCYILDDTQIQPSGFRDSEISWKDYRTKRTIWVSGYQLVKYEGAEIISAARTMNVELEKCHQSFSRLDDLEADLKFIQNLGFLRRKK